MSESIPDHLKLQRRCVVVIKSHRYQCPNLKDERNKECHQNDFYQEAQSASCTDVGIPLEKIGSTSQFDDLSHEHCCRGGGGREDVQDEL